MTVFTSKWPRKLRNSLPSVRGPTRGWDWPTRWQHCGSLGSVLLLLVMNQNDCPGNDVICDADEGVVCPELFLVCLPSPPFVSQTPEVPVLRRLLPHLCPALTSYLETELLPPVWKRSGKACSSKIENCQGLSPPAWLPPSADGEERQEWGRETWNREGSSSSPRGQQRRLGCADGARGPRLWSLKFVPRQVDPSASLHRFWVLRSGVWAKKLHFNKPGAPRQFEWTLA